MKSLDEIFGKKKSLDDIFSSKPQEAPVPKSFGDYFLDNLKDIGYGAKKGLSGMTLGASDWALRKAGITDEDYLKSKEEDGTSGVAKTAGIIAELGGSFAGAAPAVVKGVAKTGLKGLKALATEGGIIGGAYGATNTDKLEDLPQNVALGTVGGVALPIGFNYALKPVAKVAQPVINRFNQRRGLKELERQLASGDGFSEVNIGNVEDRIASEINALRNAENVSPVKSSKVVVPADRVEHIYNQRILGDGYNPKDATDVVDSALFSKSTKIARGNEPHLQIAYDTQNPANAAIIGKHRDTGDIFIKTSMKKDKRALDGRSFPSSTVDANAPSPQHLRISDFQSPYNDSIVQNTPNVNQNYGTKSFVEALADKDKSRTLKNAVMSGEEGLAEKARILQDALERRKAGMYDEGLEDLIKLPELKTAENKYAAFVDKQGDNIIPRAKVDEYYASNPVATGLIEEAREINPQAFRGVKKGSLKEFDILKQELRNSRSAGDTIGKPKQDALKRAENSLKSLMDDSFAGFRDVNSNLAKAKTNQNIFEGKLKKGLTSVGGATESPFWSGISSPLAAAGVVGGVVSPLSLLATGGGLAGKALMRAMRRSAGRDIANGVIRTPTNVNPILSAVLGGRTVDEGFDYGRQRKQLLIDLLNNGAE